MVVDFLLITALDEELQALLAQLPGNQKLDPVEDDIHTYHKASVTAMFPSGKEIDYNIIACGVMGMGRVKAAAFAATAIDTWHPRFVFMVGIAGGVVESGVSVGDVLVSDQVVDYELQKHYESHVDIRYEVYRSDPRLLGAAMQFTDPSWIESAGNRPGEGKSRRYVGPVATGDKVMARKDLIDKYRQDWPQLIGVEMEAGGVATAVFQAATNPGFFMVRGVSDLADENKDNSDTHDWRPYACDVAAAYCVAFIRSGPVPVVGSTEPLDSNLDQAIKHTLTVDLATEEVKTKIELAIAPKDKAGIFGKGGLCDGYLPKPRPQYCFLAKEAAQGDNDLKHALNSALQSFEVSPIEADDEVVSGSILCKIASLIRETRFGIYELNANQDRNVYLQLGMAIGLQRPFLLLKHRHVELSRLAGGLDYYPVDSYLELRFGLKHKVRDVVVNMSHYGHVTEEVSPIPGVVFVEHGDIEYPDFAFSVTKSLNKVGLKPIFRWLDTNISTFMEKNGLNFELIENTADNALNQITKTMMSSNLIIVRIDENASIDAPLILGMALAQNHRTILVHYNNANIPSNLLGLNRIEFKAFVELEDKLGRILGYL